MLFRYIIKGYIRYFALIFLALVVFFVGLDYLQSFKSLPSAANLQILYIIYKSFYAVDLLLPISLVFASIATNIYLVRRNELVAFYSVGYSKREIIKPMFLASGTIIALYALLHATPFAYANENAESIRKHKVLASATNDLFVKYYDKYIYFEKLYPFLKKAENVRVFRIEGDSLKELVRADEAHFMEKGWRMSGAEVVIPLQEAIEVKKDADITILQGFKPKILDSVYEGKSSFSIIDAVYAIALLKDQNVNTEKIEAVLLAQLVYPLFAPLLGVILFAFLPTTQRGGALSFYGFVSIVAALALWGILFTLLRLSYSGVLSPKISIVAPVLLLSAAAALFYRRF